MINFTLALLAVAATATRVAQDDVCLTNWYYETCSNLFYRDDYCTDDCGKWYRAEGDDDEDAWWVTCDERNSRDYCNIDWLDWYADGGEDGDMCTGDWKWDDCNGLFYRSDNCTDDCGRWYRDELDDDEDAWWVTCDEFNSWEECSDGPCFDFYGCDEDWEVSGDEDWDVSGDEDWDVSGDEDWDVSGEESVGSGEDRDVSFEEPVGSGEDRDVSFEEPVGSGEDWDVSGEESEGSGEEDYPDPDYPCEDCLGDWIWEECSSLFYREDWCTDYYGWWYTSSGDDNEDAWWVSAEEFDSWEGCEI